MGPDMATIIYFLLMVVHFTSANIYLKTLSTLYLPYKYENNIGKFGYDEKAAEQFAYDSENKIVYTVGDRLILVIDVSNVSNPALLYHKTMPNTAMKDIEACGDFVIISRVDNLNTDNGIVEIYGKYNTKTKEMPLKRVIQVGKDPDMVLPTSDCKTILVSLEAEAYPNMDASQLIDPPGGIGIIKFSTSDLSQTPTYKTVDFSSFNNRWSELVNKGARFIYRNNGNTFANDIEPEGITFNADETIAYIALQENNAIAELNMKTETITNIYPLGYKDWRKYRLDVSDKDNKIDMRPWPVYGMYQPDAIQYFTVGGKSYIVSANEGGSQDYSDYVSNGFNEEVRVKDVIFDENSEVLKWAAQNGFTSSTIKEDKYLGRLKVTTIEGRINGTNKHNALYTFGARSFTIWRIDSTGLVNVYDSGSDMEDKIKQLRPNVFNADCGEKSYLLSATKDLLSDKRGPEPEMVTTGQYKGKTLLFVSAEQPGMIFIYSINKDVTKPKYESMWSGIPTINDKTWKELYEKRQISGLDPEDIRFIDEIKSPNGKALVMAVGTVSSTLSIFQIEDSGEPTGSAACLSSALVLMVVILQLCLSRLVSN